MTNEPEHEQVEAGELEQPFKQTPESAIQSMIFYLCQRRAEIRKENNLPYQQHIIDVLAYIQEQLDALHLAMQQLEELREIKRALAILQNLNTSTEQRHDKI